LPTFSIAVYLPIIVGPLDIIYPLIIIYSSVTIGSLVIIVNDSIKGKQILASYILAESQWITFQYGIDRYIVIKQTQLMLWKVFWLQ
jgi:hypothetical protein